MILQMKKPDVEVPGWRGYMLSVVVRLVGRTAKFSKMRFDAAYGREMDIKLSGNCSGRYSCMPIARSLKTRDICGILLCDKTTRVNFYCPQHKVHPCNDHAV